MVTATPARPRSLSVWKVLLGAAALGSVSGVVLASMRRPPEDFEERADALAKKAIPGGDPVVLRPVSPEREPENFMAPDPRSLEGIPPYPGADPRRLVSSHPGAEQTLAISWFNTDDSVDKVLSYYERAFADGNVGYAAHRYNERRGYVSWFQHQFPKDGPPVFGKGLLHMVAVSREGDHTTVLVSVSEPQKILERVAPLPAGVRLPAGATPQVINTSEFGQQRASVIADYEMGIEAVRSQLKDIWKESGWKVVEQTDDTYLLELNARQQTVVLSGTDLHCQVFVNLEERQAAANSRAFEGSSTP
jgi:hypothetical protein